MTLLLCACLAWSVLRSLAVVSGAGGGPWFSAPVSAGVSIAAGLLALARARHVTERWPWALIGLGGVCWGVADMYWTTLLEDAADIPVPSWADAGYLAFPVLVFAGLCGLVAARLRGAPRTVWLDGLTGGLAAAALSAAIVLERVLPTVEGDRLGIATNLAYPVADLMLMSVIIAATALSGWRLDRTWALLGLGILLFWVADSAYLVTIADGSYSYGTVFDDGWTLCLIALAAAAWQPVPARTRVVRSAGRDAAFPAICAAASLGVLVVAAVGDLNLLAVGLAGASVLLVLPRLGITLRENARMLEASRHEALTDALTGLGNRRSLAQALAEVLEGGAAAPDHTLVLLDLDGFKHYNDLFGHPAGDALLARLGRRLTEQAAADGGRAFRMGGDEFCVVLPGGEPRLGGSAAAALAEHGDGFTVGASFGTVRLPAEAGVVEEALRLADQRMYAQKHGGRASASSQSRDVLLRVLAERNPELGVHVDDVAALAESVARELGLDDRDVQDICSAAELHDVGKVAIPDAILHKPGPLTDEEWAFMHRHTVIGERIVLAAPSLSGVASLVRSSHERWDGGGYPDKLAGAAIPVGAQVVAVCDAYDAMTTDRAYRAAMTEADAVAELLRCRGSQFAPFVVDALMRVRSRAGAPAV